MDIQYSNLNKISNRNELKNIKLYKRINDTCLDKVKEQGLINLIFFFLAGKKEINYICKNMILSEEWIHANKEKVNWKYISQYQNISPQFIDEHKDQVNMDIILDKNKFIRNYPKFCSVYKMSFNQNNDTRYLRNYFEDRDIIELNLINYYPNLIDHERVCSLIARIPHSNSRRERLTQRYMNFLRSYSQN